MHSLSDVEWAVGLSDMLFYMTNTPPTPRAMPHKRTQHSLLRQSGSITHPVGGVKEITVMDSAFGGDIPPHGTPRDEIMARPVTATCIRRPANYCYRCNCYRCRLKQWW